MNKPVCEVRNYTVRVILDSSWTAEEDSYAFDELLADIELLTGVIEVIGEWPDDTIFVTASTEVWPISDAFILRLTILIERAEKTCQPRHFPT